jgi:hypothetical protein
VEKYDQPNAKGSENIVLEINIRPVKIQDYTDISRIRKM